MGQGAEYRPLKGSEIRLLRVAPGAWDDQVSCTIHYVALDERPEYIALSYTWGDASDQVDILLDGRPHRATRSLFTALRRYRKMCAEGRGLDGFTFSSSPDGTAYIWADALCINQADDAEKVKEIPRMRDVYMLCTRVCVWLGENDEEWDEDAEIRAVLEDFERFIGPGSFGKDIQHNEWMSPEYIRGLRREMEDHFGPRVETLLDLWVNLGGRAWFGRVWIIQEVALPAADPIMVAGGYMFGFECFTRICEVVWTLQLSRSSTAGLESFALHGALIRTRFHTKDNPIRIEGGPEERRLQFGRVYGQALEEQGTNSFGATNTHDYLYSMIGLCGGGELLPPELAPDYQKPFPKVCEDYARCIMKATGSVATLGRSFNDLFVDYEGHMERPLWVPDFRAPLMGVSVEGDVDPSGVSFVGPNDRFLKVRGFDVGKVIAKQMPLEPPEGDDSCSLDSHVKHLHKFIKKVARERDISPREAVGNWLAGRLLIEQSAIWTTRPTVEDLQALYYHYLHLDDGDHAADDDDARAQSLQDSDIAKHFAQLMQKVLSHEIKFLCQGGVDAKMVELDGRTPVTEPRPGFHLLALSGCRYPFLVRPVLTSEGDGWVHFGFCYAYDGAEEVNYKANDFSLEWFDESEFEDFIIA